MKIILETPFLQPLQAHKTSAPRKKRKMNNNMVLEDARNYIYHPAYAFAEEPPPPPLTTVAALTPIAKTTADAIPRIMNGDRHYNAYNHCNHHRQQANTGAPNWPGRFAKHISDEIHHRVQKMLSESRLTGSSNENDILLIHPEDIFSVDRVLGSGAFSKVSACTVHCCNDGRKRRRYAYKHLQRKLMEKPEDFQLAASELALEAHILSSLDHPNIVKIRGWAANGVAAYENGKHDSFFLILDLLHDTLDQRIDRWRQHQHRQETTAFIPVHTAVLPTTAISYKYHHDNHNHHNRVNHELFLEKIRIMSELASALEYIHSHRIIFRDLKPTNIGFLPTPASEAQGAVGGTVQIFDFGLSRELPSLDTTTPFSMSGKVGTLRYMAPEVATNHHYNVSADVYSYGVVSYEVLTLERPYDGWTKDQHAEFVCKQGVRPETTNTIHPIPSELIPLFEQTWNAVPTNRGTMSEINAHLQWYLKCYLNRSSKNHCQVQHEDHKLQQQLNTCQVGPIDAYQGHVHHLPNKLHQFYPHQDQQQQQQQLSLAQAVTEAAAATATNMIPAPPMRPIQTNTTVGTGSICNHSVPSFITTINTPPSLRNDWSPTKPEGTTTTVYTAPNLMTKKQRTHTRTISFETMEMINTSSFSLDSSTHCF